MRWEISLVEGWAMILAGGILDGEAYVWPDARLSRTGRKMRKVKDLAEKVKRGAWTPRVDL